MSEFLAESDQARQSLLHQAGEYVDHSQFRRLAPIPTSQRSFFETPSDPNRASSFLNLRVADIWPALQTMGRQRSVFFLPNH